MSCSMYLHCNFLPLDIKLILISHGCLPSWANMALDLIVLSLCHCNHCHDDDIMHCGYDHASISAKEKYVLKEVDSKWF